MASPYLPIWLKGALHDAANRLDALKRLIDSDVADDRRHAGETAEHLGVAAVRLLHLTATMSEAFGRRRR